MRRIRVGAWRDDATGPMQVVSGGNGRIARAVGDLWLARSDGSPQRFYSLSARIQRERSAYYGILERTQKGTLDATDWMTWFLEALIRAIGDAQRALDGAITRARAWERFAGLPLNARQNALLAADGRPLDPRNSPGSEGPKI